MGKGTIMYPCKIYSVEALTLTVAVFDSGASREVIKVKWGQKGGALIH